jgi:serine protease Do
MNMNNYINNLYQRSLAFSLHKVNLSFKEILTLALVLYMGITQNSFASPLDDIFSAVKKAIPFNPFDTTGIEFNRLVDAEDYSKAEDFFSKNFEAYFDKRFNIEQNEITQQLQKLGRNKLESAYSEKAQSFTGRLQKIETLKENVQNAWSNASVATSDAENLAKEISSNDLLRTSRVGSSYEQALQAEIDRVKTIASRDRQEALSLTFAEVLRTGVIPSGYPYQSFTDQDYKRSEVFQNQISALLDSTIESDQAAMLALLTRVTSGSTSEKRLRSANLRDALKKLGNGPYPLEKISELRALVKEFGAESGLQNAVKIGYIDLTATSFKDRNTFDFELAFEKDYGLSIQDAKEDFLGKGTTSEYDFIFVTDLSAAKIFREFKNKRDVESKVKSGSREKQNPEYVTALSAYQQAMTEMQSTKLQNAATANQPCGSIMACLLVGALKGMSNNASESSFKAKADALARTSQTITEPVYSNYKYQLVDINASKVARVDYYVIDVRNRLIYQNYFEIKNSERFTVSYNIEESDPDGSSLLKNNQREEDVTAWEKKPIAVKLSNLFEPTNLKQNSPKPFTNVDAFLKPLTTRQYASASPTYVSTANPSKIAIKSTSSKDTAVQNIPVGLMATSSSTPNQSSVIADERFDSVLIVKTSKAIGTGFYVTPELILTAFHVVDGSNLVEMTFYDGTKTFGKVIDSDVRLDLAIIKAQVAGKPVKIHSGQIRLGETVEAIGHPKGYEFTITRGVVSALRKQSSTLLKSGPPIEFVQTDTPISPGNSGGPLFLKDSVIGVNDWVRVDKASQNLNFSVSYNEIQAYLNRFEGKSK